MINRSKKLFQKWTNVNLAPFWKIMARNWIMKILCLLLAIAVWQGIRESISFEMVVADVPVTITTGVGRAVLDQSTDTVNIRFRGSQDDIRLISKDQISVKIHIPSQTDRLRQTIKFSSRYVKAPSQAHAVQFDPSEVTITVDREVDRVLAVKTMFEGKLPDGIQLEKIGCIPASVRVCGAERLLCDLEQVRTLPISLDGRYNTFTTDVALAAGGQLWSASPERVKITLTLAEHLATRRIEEIYVRFLLASNDTRILKLHPREAAVVLSGSSKQIEELKASEIYLYIDCTDLTESTDYEMPIRADIPPGLQVDKIDPPIVRVNVKRM